MLSPSTPPSASHPAAHPPAAHPRATRQFPESDAVPSHVHSTACPLRFSSQSDAQAASRQLSTNRSVSSSKPSKLLTLFPIPYSLFPIPYSLVFPFHRQIE